MPAPAGEQAGGGAVDRPTVGSGGAPDGGRRIAMGWRMLTTWHSRVSSRADPKRKESWECG
jgi:hypothetical protein